MTRGKLVLLGFFFLLVGCTDTVDSVTREYRNATNEVIDAMMMITDESSAERMRVRIIKPMATRFKEIDEHLNTVRNNRTTKELAKEFLESPGFQLYLTDMEFNMQRYAIEMTRLRNLLKQYAKQKRDQLDADGQFDEEIKLDVLCPNLEKVTEGAELETLRNQFPKCYQMAMSVRNLRKADGFFDNLKKFQKKREDAFMPKPVKLAD